MPGEATKSASWSSLEQSEPLVSVITPVFNGELTLKRAHDSLRRQSGQWQHIVVDDGSTDGTPAVIQDLAGDPRVISVRTENRGISAAHNTGIEVSAGDFIAFLDADDEYLPDHISAHLAAMSEQPEVDLFWGGLEVIVNHPEDILVPDVSAGYGFISIEDCVAQGTLFVRRRVFDLFRFNEDRAIWWQDLDFVSRVKSRFVARRFDQRTYRYYRNSGSSAVDQLKKNWPTGGQSGEAARSVSGQD
jgi:glycosyltransferase involved in cell wall biosynthesis